MIVRLDLFFSPIFFYIYINLYIWSSGVLNSTFNLYHFRECSVQPMSPIRLIMSAETSVGRLWAQEEASGDAPFGWVVGYKMSPVLIYKIKVQGVLSVPVYRPTAVSPMLLFSLCAKVCPVQGRPQWAWLWKSTWCVTVSPATHWMGTTSVRGWIKT